MNAIISNLAKVIPLFVWFILGGLGGYWLTHALFRLRPNEELLVGLSVGLIAETWLVNLLGRILPMLTASWVAVLIVLVGGFVLSFPKSAKQFKALFHIQIDIWVWIIAFILIGLFFGIGTGMGLYDEYPVLPLISQMAAGDMPPHFALDPKVIYNYHYFPYLFSAQLMRLGNLFPWTALDLQRGIFLTLSLILLGLWVYRITHNKFAGIAAGIFSFFAGGTRWLLLLIPSGALDFIDKYVIRMDSGLNSGTTLQAALTSPWAAQGTGPYTIPFAYGNGFNPATTIGLGTTNLPLLFLAIFLLTMNRWKDWKAIGLNVVLLAALALAHEITFVMIALGILMVALFFVVKNKTIKIPRQLTYFFIAVGLAGIIVLFQGGVITGIFQQMIAKTNLPQLSDESYQNVGFFLSFPPAVVDAHLGTLSLFNPVQLFVLILEIGPMLFLLWPTLIWGFKSVRGQRWFEAILAAMIIVSLGLAFFQISLKAGSIGSITRAQNYFTVILKIFAIPFLFLWLPTQKEKIKIFTTLLIAITLLGGIVIFGLELTAIQKPILSMGYNDLDAKIMRQYWNKLDTNYMVFDAHPIRTAVLFGHATDAAIDWFTYKPDWEALVNNPDPTRLQEAGYGYFYTDQAYLRSLPAIVTQRIGSSCVKVLADYKDDFGAERILMDIRDCQ